MMAVDPVQKLSKETILLGKLAVREKFMSERDVNLCLRLQAKEGEKRSIGEVMVEQGYLTPEQLKRRASSPVPAARGRSRRGSRRTRSGPTRSWIRPSRVASRRRARRPMPPCRRRRALRSGG